MSTNSLPIIAGPSGASSRGSHQLSCVAECPRKWMLRYRKRIVPTAEPRFRLGGTLIHDALAHYYAVKMPTKPTWWTGSTLDETLIKSGAGYPELIDASRQCVAAYHDQWFSEPWTPVAVEEEFRATIGELDPGGPDPTLDDEVVTCGTDLVVRHTSTGDLWIVDHKTKSHGWGRIKKLPKWKGADGEYAISWQANINLHLIRKRFPDENVRGFIINRVTRDEPWDFDRHVLEISPMVYKKVPSVLRWAVAREREIDGMLLADESPVPAYWACNTQWGPCDYLPICNAHSPEDVDSIVAMQFKMRD